MRGKSDKCGFRFAVCTGTDCLFPPGCSEVGRYRYFTGSNFVKLYLPRAPQLRNCGLEFGYTHLARNRTRGTGGSQTLQGYSSTWAAICYLLNFIDSELEVSSSCLVSERLKARGCTHKELVETGAGTWGHGETEGQEDGERD